MRAISQTVLTKAIDSIHRLSESRIVVPARCEDCSVRNLLLHLGANRRERRGSCAWRDGVEGWVLGRLGGYAGVSTGGRRLLEVYRDCCCHHHCHCGLVR